MVADTPRRRRGAAFMIPAVALAALLVPFGLFGGARASAQEVEGPTSVRGGTNVRLRVRTGSRRMDRRLELSARRVDARRVDARRLAGRSRSWDEQRLARDTRRLEKSRRDERRRTERARKTEDRRRADWERHRKDKKRMIR